MVNWITKVDGFKEVSKTLYIQYGIINADWYHWHVQIRVFGSNAKWSSLSKRTYFSLSQYHFIDMYSFTGNVSDCIPILESFWQLDSTCSCICCPLEKLWIIESLNLVQPLVPLNWSHFYTSLCLTSTLEWHQWEQHLLCVCVASTVCLGTCPVCMSLLCVLQSAECKRCWHGKSLAFMMSLPNLSAS